MLRSVGSRVPLLTLLACLASCGRTDLYPLDGVADEASVPDAPPDTRRDTLPEPPDASLSALGNERSPDLPVDRTTDLATEAPPSAPCMLPPGSNAGALVFSPSALDLGPVRVGTVLAVAVFPLLNTGRTAVSVTGVTLTGQGF